MVSIVSAFAINELNVVFAIHESGKHLLVSKWPVSVGVVEIVAPVLEKNAQGLFIASFADESWVVVASSYVGKAADMA